MTSALDQKGLKPCPFCGGKAERAREWGGRLSLLIHCSEANCLGHHYEQDEMGGYNHEYGSLDEAIAAWNRRSTVIPAEIAGVRSEPVQVYIDHADHTVATSLQNAIEDMKGLLAQGWDLQTEAHFMLAISALTAQTPPVNQSEGAFVNKPRKMTGFIASLSEEGKKNALAYKGDDTHGSASFKNSTKLQITS